jgi:hypothetical protein
VFSTASDEFSDNLFSSDGGVLMMQSEAVGGDFLVDFAMS